jgi:hypothetical protein
MIDIKTPVHGTDDYAGPSEVCTAWSTLIVTRASRTLVKLSRGRFDRHIWTKGAACLKAYDFGTLANRDD